MNKPYIVKPAFGMLKQNPLMLPGYGTNKKYPVFHLSIPGCLPSSSIGRKFYVEAREYFTDQVLSAYHWEDNDIHFGHAIVYIAQFFKCNKARDLDNMNAKPLIDALKQTFLFEDDSFHYLSFLCDGFYDGKKDHIWLIVMERDRFWEFERWWRLTDLDNPMKELEFVE